VSSSVALVLTGGGARAAYQAGVLRSVAHRHPDLEPAVLTGVSAGAINAAVLATREGSFRDGAESLAATWSRLEMTEVLEVDLRHLALGAGRWLLRLGGGGARLARQPRALLDTRPLWDLLRRALAADENDELPAIAANVARGRVRSVALSTLSWTTGITTTWVEGRGTEAWERPGRRAVAARLSIAHVMASAALPLLFPAVRLGEEWHGDGGVRLSAPLSPALHLGASRVLAVSTRRARVDGEVVEPIGLGYPPPAQVAGLLLNALFLDVVDQDVQRIERVNKLLAAVPAERRTGMRHVDLLVLRPSQDLGRLASGYEARLPRGFRFFMRGLGTKETSSNDLLSLIMFQPGYLSRLVEMGEEDGEARADEIDAFLAGTSPAR